MTPRQRTFTPGSNRRLLWLALVIPLAALGVYLFISKGLLAPRAITNSLVQTAVAQRGNLVVSASGTGTLISQTDASFGFGAGGPVREVYVKVGDHVEAGEILAQLDDTLAQMNYVEAAQALNELHSAASIAAVQHEIGTAQDAEFYAHEWLKYLLSPEVVQAEENLAIAQRRLADAQMEAAVNPSDNTAQTVKEKQQAVDYLQDKLTQAQQYYEEYYLPETFGTYENVGSRRHPKQVLAIEIDPKTGEAVPVIDEPSAADITTARSNYAQALETVKEGQLYLEALNTNVIPEGAAGEKFTALYEAQLALEKARSAIEATELVAPVSGTVTSLALSVGEQADTSSVITISQLSQPYTLEAYLDEADWDKAQVGNSVTVAFDLLPGQTYPGKVTLVYPELSESFESSLVHLVVQLDHSLSQDLPAGTGATVDVIGGEARGAVLVPVEAIHRTEDGQPAVIIFRDGQQIERPIEIGLQNGTYAEVKSGLEVGEIVVTG